MKRKKVLALLLTGVLTVMPFHAAAALSVPEENVAEELYALLNQYRNDNGIAGYIRLDKADYFAEENALFMAENKEVSNRPISEVKGFEDETGVDWQETVAWCWKFAEGEEPASDKELAKKLLKALQDMPTHVQSLLRFKDNIIGIGVARDENRIYVSVNTGFEKGAVSDQTHKPQKDIPALEYNAGLENEEDMRAIIGAGYIVRGRNHALNGATRIVMKLNANGTRTLYLADDNGNPVHSKGLVYWYEMVPGSNPRPVTRMQNGVQTQFADIPGTDYINYPEEF